MSFLLKLLFEMTQTNIRNETANLNLHGVGG